MTAAPPINHGCTANKWSQCVEKSAFLICFKMKTLIFRDDHKELCKMYERAMGDSQIMHRICFGEPLEITFLGSTVGYFIFINE